MKLNLCDYCRKIISDEADMFISIIVTNQNPNHDLHSPYVYDPAAKPREQQIMEVCEGCAQNKGILQTKGQKLKLVPAIGRLTDEEIAELEKMP